MTTTLPPIGAKIRVIRKDRDATTVTIEGVVSAHPVRPEKSYVLVGEHNIAAYLVPDPDTGESVDVEVLLPPEPPINTVLLSRKPNPGRLSGGPAEIVTVLWRDDAAASGDEFRWFSSHHGFEQSFRWAEVQPERGETIVRLVPDRATDAPDLPFVGNDGDGNTIEVRVDRDERLVEIAAAPAGRAHNPAAIVRMSGLSAGILGAVLLRAEQETAQR